MNRHVYVAVALLALIACESPSESSVPGGFGGLALSIESSSSTSLDEGRVIVSGPTNKTVSATPGAAVTVDGLTPGSYTVTLEGLVGGAVDQFAQITGVQVVAGQNKQVTATLTSFRPVISDPTLSPDGLQFEVAFPAVPAADSYRVEVATNANFTGAVASNVTGPSAQFPINGQFGAYFIRALAFDPLRNLGRFSDPKQVTISDVGSTTSLDGSVDNAGFAWTDGFDPDFNDSGAGPGLGPIVGDADGVAFHLQFRQFYSFDLTSVPTGAVISSAVLRLFQTLVRGFPYSFGDVMVEHVDYGDQLTGSEHNIPGTRLGTLSPTGPAIDYKTLDVTGQIRNDFLGTPPRSQFRLRFSSTDGNDDGVDDYAAFGDAEQSWFNAGRTTQSDVPHLILIYH